jgi:hypothetical protein
VMRDQRHDVFRTRPSLTRSAPAMAQRSVGVAAEMELSSGEAHSASSASVRPEDDGLKRSTHKPSVGSVGQKNRTPHEIGLDLLTKAETVMVAAIEACVPTLVGSREIILPLDDPAQA